MKTIVSLIKIWLPLLFVTANAMHANAQSKDSCNMMGSQCLAALISSSGNALTEIESGRDFNISLTLPGLLNCNGDYHVLIGASPNITQGTTAANYPYPFDSLGNNEYGNGTVLHSTGSGGIGINIPFKFLPGVTCNGETGTFKITISDTCADGSKHQCVLNIALTAKATNYWVVDKHRVFGNLSGGAIYWDVVITNTNGNRGIGDLNIVRGSFKDVVSSDEIISVTGGGLSGLAGLNTTTATWNTGAIPSTIDVVVYHVVTYSCKPAGTVVENCVDFDFCLGKEVSLHPWPPSGSVVLPELKKGSTKKTTPGAMPVLPGGGMGQLQKICCSGATGHACDHVTLVGSASTSANFAKIRTYGTNLNYSQGCEGEYELIVSNNGNVPLTNLNITDSFPPLNQINVTQITVSSTGASMGYSVPTGNPSTGYDLAGPNYSQTWTSGFPTSFNLTTNSGSLLNQVITIKIKFKIIASAGTPVKNCASLGYDGTYNGWANWCGITLPAAGAGLYSQSCDSFSVEQPKSIPGITKCIPNGQQTYSVGDNIHFRIAISNHGAGNFSGNLADLLGAPQNLQLVSGSVTYAQGEGYFNPYSTSPQCISPSDLSNPSNWSPPVLSQTSQSLSGAISNMPGDCELEKAYYLIIEFDAKVLPQSFGPYYNTTTLTTTTGTLNTSAPYNVMRVAKIITNKKASSEYVEPGQPFSYIVNISNPGSVASSAVQVQDVLPGCVTPNGQATAIKINANGATSAVTVAGTAPNFNFPGLTIQPGDTVRLTIPVTRAASDLNKTCCNAEAKVTATTTDSSAQHISDENGPACVASGMCCNIKDVNVSFSVSNINGNIVPVFLITTGNPLPIQEIEISLVDYHAEYNQPSCKPLNMGDLLGHIQPFQGYSGSSYYNFNTIPPSGTPSLPLQTVINPVNNSLTWAGTTPISLYTGSSWNFNGLVALYFIAPDILNLDCCTGKVYFCFKVRLKDVNCNICEKIVCGSADIPKAADLSWVNSKAKARVKLKALEITQPQPKNNNGKLEDIFRRKPIKSNR